MSSKHTLNRTQAAEHLGISIKTLSRYMKDHGLRAIKAPGYNNRLEYRFSIEELDKWDYVRKNIPSIRPDKANQQPTETIDKGQDQPGQGQDKENERERSKTGQEDSLLELLLSSYKEQITTLQEQLAQKDEQIRTLQESSASLLQLAQAQMNRIEYQAPDQEQDKPKKRKRTKFPTDRQASLDMIWKLHKKGLSEAKIAKKINKTGRPTLSGKGKWQPGTINKLLKEIKKK